MRTESGRATIRQAGPRNWGFPDGNYLIDDPKKVVNGLLGGSFGSFKKRCDLAYTLGLIGPDMHSDLDQIREIRNEFAHSYSDLDFSASDVLDRCKNLKIAALSDPGKDSSARDRFIISASLLASHFVRQMKGTPHRETGKDYRALSFTTPASFLVGEKRVRRSTGDAKLDNEKRLRKSSGDG